MGGGLQELLWEPLIDLSHLGQPQLGTRWDGTSLGSFVRSSEQERRRSWHTGGRQAVHPTESWLGLGAAPPEHRGHCLHAGVHGCSVFQSWPGASETCLMPSLAQTRQGALPHLNNRFPGCLSSATELCSLIQQKRPASLRCLLCPGQGRGACPLRALSVGKPVGRRTLGANVCCAL